jgi:hypothetical protein
MYIYIYIYMFILPENRCLPISKICGIKPAGTLVRLWIPFSEKLWRHRYLIGARENIELLTIQKLKNMQWYNGKV